MGYNFTKLSEVIVAEEISEAAHVLVEDGGEVKRVAKTMVGGIPVYKSEELTRELKLELLKNRTMHIVSTGGNSYVTTGFCAVKDYYDDCGDLYEGNVEIKYGGTYKGGEIEDATEEEIDEILSAWGVS